MQSNLQCGVTGIFHIYHIVTEATLYMFVLAVPAQLARMWMWRGVDFCIVFCLGGDTFKEIMLCYVLDFANRRFKYSESQRSTSSAFNMFIVQHPRRSTFSAVNIFSAQHLQRSTSSALTSSPLNIFSSAFNIFSVQHLFSAFTCSLTARSNYLHCWLTNWLHCWLPACWTAGWLHGCSAQWNRGATRETMTCCDVYGFLHIE